MVGVGSVVGDDMASFAKWKATLKPEPAKYWAVQMENVVCQRRNIEAPPMIWNPGTSMA